MGGESAWGKPYLGHFGGLEDFGAERNVGGCWRERKGEVGRGAGQLQQVNNLYGQQQ